MNKNGVKQPKQAGAETQYELKKGKKKREKQIRKSRCRKTINSKIRKQLTQNQKGIK